MNGIDKRQFEAEYLACSAGVQSHCLLEMVLRGHISKPKHFVVINADPGMENETTYALKLATEQRCIAAGIPFLTARAGTLFYPAENLFQQLVNLKASGRTRMDLPPYWTRNRETGKKGRLKQRCTREFKVRPMRKALRSWLKTEFPSVSVHRIAVKAWIGFADDEGQRAKSAVSDVKYITHYFPLIELGMDRLKVEGYYLKHGIAKPARSVCNACFANGLAMLEDMYQNRPNDWDQAVAVDDSIRELGHVGATDQCFVSATLVPLRDLPGRDFLRGTPEGKEHRCNSGVCFV